MMSSHYSNNIFKFFNIDEKNEIQLYYLISLGCDYLNIDKEIIQKKYFRRYNYFDIVSFKEIFIFNILEKVLYLIAHDIMFKLNSNKQITSEEELVEYNEKVEETELLTYDFVQHYLFNIYDERENNQLVQYLLKNDFRYYINNNIELKQFIDRFYKDNEKYFYI